MLPEFKDASDVVKFVRNELSPQHMALGREWVRQFQMLSQQVVDGTIRAFEMEPLDLASVDNTGSVNASVLPHRPVENLRLDATITRNTIDFKMNLADLVGTAKDAMPEHARRIRVVCSERTCRREDGQSCHHLMVGDAYVSESGPSYRCIRFSSSSGSSVTLGTAQDGQPERCQECLRRAIPLTKRDERFKLARDIIMLEVGKRMNCHSPGLMSNRFVGGCERGPECLCANVAVDAARAIADAFDKED